jgi:hypothetical protein
MLDSMAIQLRFLLKGLYEVDMSIALSCLSSITCVDRSIDYTLDLYFWLQLVPQELLLVFDYQEVHPTSTSTLTFAQPDPDPNAKSKFAQPCTIME